MMVWKPNHLGLDSHIKAQVHSGYITCPAQSQAWRKCATSSYYWKSFGGAGNGSSGGRKFQGRSSYVAGVFFYSHLSLATLSVSYQEKGNGEEKSHQEWWFITQTMSPSDNPGGEREQLVLALDSGEVPRPQVRRFCRKVRNSIYMQTSGLSVNHEGMHVPTVAFAVNYKKHMCQKSVLTINPNKKEKERKETKVSLSFLQSTQNCWAPLRLIWLDEMGLYFSEW